MITDVRPLETKLKELIDDIYQFIQRKSAGNEPHSWYGEINEVFVRRLKKIIKDEK